MDATRHPGPWEWPAAVTRAGEWLDPDWRGSGWTWSTVRLVTPLNSPTVPLLISQQDNIADDDF